MRLDINRKDTYNCLQNLVSAIAQYYQVDYRMMMLELWGFQYSRDKEPFGERLGLCWSGQLDYRNKLLADFHGIVIKYYQKISDISNIKDVVKKTPVAFYVDSYDCEWLPFYQKQHRSHLCNVVDIDTTYCYCQDEYWNKEPYKQIKVDEIEKSRHRSLVFLKDEGKKASTEDIAQKIFEAVKRYEACDCLNKMELFLEDFPREFDIAFEVANNDPVSSKVIMYLKCFGDDKKNLLECFEYIQEKIGIEVAEIIYMLNEQSKKWYRIRNYLIKSYFGKKKLDENIIKQELFEIYSYEKSIYQSISCIF